MTDEMGKRQLSKGRIVLVGFLAFALLLLFTEHRAHVLGILPYLILLACPLMHLFMHHEHGQDGNGSHRHNHPEGESK